MTYGSSSLNKLELHNSTFISKFSFSIEKYGENVVEIWIFFVQSMWIFNKMGRIIKIFPFLEHCANSTQRKKSLLPSWEALLQEDGSFSFFFDKSVSLEKIIMPG